MTTMDHEAGARRVRASARAGNGEARSDDLSLLLLGAAGLAAGVGLALAVRRPATRRRLVRTARAVRRDLDRAARAGASRGRRALRAQPVDDVRDTVTGYVDAAREAIAEAAAAELRSLRKAMRRQRKQLGL